MKIIGTADTNFIVEISRSEIANLLGETYLNNDLSAKLKTGTTINVHTIFSRLQELHRIPMNIQSVVATLKAASSWLSGLDQLALEAVSTDLTGEI